MQLPETKESDVFWKLEDMTCDQLSKLLTQLGTSRNGMKKKDMIVAIDAIDKESVDWTAIKEVTVSAKTETNLHGNMIVFRVINVLFNAIFLVNLRRSMTTMIAKLMKLTQRICFLRKFPTQ